MPSTTSADSSHEAGTCPLLVLAKAPDPNAEVAQRYAAKALELASSPRGAAYLTTISQDTGPPAKSRKP